MKLNCKLHDPWVIETDYVGDINFFQKYMDDIEWVDTNKLYDSYDEYHEAMENTQYMNRHYIKHIKNFDMPLKKYILQLFRALGIKSKDWRAEFFLTKAGGNVPMHIDTFSKAVILLPLSKNTGPLVCEKDGNTFELTYQTLTVLNTQNMHGVEPPTEDRLLFRVATHDVDFEDVGVYKELANAN